MRLQERACHEDNEFGRERVAVAIRNVDPTNEAACRVLMQCCFGRGDVAGALRRLQGSLEPARFRMRHGTVRADAGAGCRNQACRSGTGTAFARGSAGLRRRRRRTPTPRPGRAPNPRSSWFAPSTMTVSSETDMRRVNGFRHDLIAALTRLPQLVGSRTCRGRRRHAMSRTRGLRTPRHGHDRGRPDPHGGAPQAALRRPLCVERERSDRRRRLASGQAACHRAPRRGAGYPDIGGASGDGRAGCPTSISTFSRRSCLGARRSHRDPRRRRHVFRAHSSRFASARRCRFARHRRETRADGVAREADVRSRVQRRSAAGGDRPTSVDLATFARERSASVCCRGVIQSRQQ